MSDFKDSLAVEKTVSSLVACIWSIVNPQGRQEAELNVQGAMNQLGSLQEELGRVRQQLETETLQKESLTAEFSLQLNKSITENSE